MPGSSVLSLLCPFPELALCIRWPKYWSFSFSILMLQPGKLRVPEYLGLDLNLGLKNAKLTYFLLYQEKGESGAPRKRRGSKETQIY